jgi:hypothetical protein
VCVCGCVCVVCLSVCLCVSVPVRVVTTRFECNYGVPFPVNFDKLFGTWVEHHEFKALGGQLPKKLRDSIARRSGRRLKEEMAGAKEEEEKENDKDNEKDKEKEKESIGDVGDGGRRR